MKCININSKEFQELKRVTRLSSLELTRVVTQFQNERNTDAYPSLIEVDIRTNKLQNHQLVSENNLKNLKLQTGKALNLTQGAIVNDFEKGGYELAYQLEVEKQMGPLAKDLGVGFKTENTTQNSNKIRYENGDVIVNFNNITPADSISTLVSPLKNGGTIEGLKVAREANVEPTPIKITNLKFDMADRPDDKDGFHLSDQPGSFLFVHNDEVYLLEKQHEDQSESKSVGEVVDNKLAKKLDSNDPNVKSLKEFIGTKDHVVIEGDTIEVSPNSTESTTEVLISVIDDKLRGINQENAPKSVGQLKFDDEPTVEPLALNDNVELYMLGPLSFKTEQERKDYIREIAQSDPELAPLAEDFVNSGYGFAKIKNRSLVLKFKKLVLEDIRRKEKQQRDTNKANGITTNIETYKGKAKDIDLSVKNKLVINVIEQNSVNEAVDSQTPASETVIKDKLEEIADLLKELEQSYLVAKDESDKLEFKNAIKIATRRYRVLNDGVDYVSTYDFVTEFIAEQKAELINYDLIPSKDENGNINFAYTAYGTPESKARTSDGFARSVAKDHKMAIDKFGLEYSGEFGRFFGVNYKLSKDDEMTLQKKIEIMSKQLDVNIILDPQLEGKAALLSKHAYESVQARKEGDTRPIIILNPELLTSDSVFHEFGHLYIELLGGLSDPKVASAVELLLKSELPAIVRKEYPHLVGENFDKELLATALGMEADRIFKRQLQNLSIWSRMWNGFYDALQSMLNINQNHLKTLAKELLGKKQLRVKRGARYEGDVTYFSKYKIDDELDPIQEAIRLFDELQRNSDMNEDTHTYVIDDEVMKQSISAIAHRMAVRKYNAKNKGDIELKFDENDYSVDTILLQLNSPKIPYALAAALDSFVDGEIKGADHSFEVVGTNWFDNFLHYSDENMYGSIDATQIKVKQEFDKRNPGKVSNMRRAVLANYDKIVERATRIQKTLDSSSIMGNAVHTAMEKFIKENEDFPQNLHNIGNLQSAIEAILDRGNKIGSKFFSEQILFDEDTKSPGTADLIEILPDGTFRIYDFKTTKTFKNKDGGDLSAYELLYKKGYVHQLMSYGEILKKYGFKPHEDPYHILMTEVRATDKENPVESTDDDITLGGFRNFSIKNLKGLDNVYRKSQSKVELYFANKKVANVNVKSEITDLEDATDRMYQVIDKFYKSMYHKSKNLNTAYSFDDVKKALEDSKDEDGMLEAAEKVKFEYKRYVSKDNKLVISKFLNSIHAMMADLSEFHADGEVETSSEYLQSLNYILQVAESLNDIKKGLSVEELTKNETFTEEDALILDQKINETLDAIAKNREFYRTKVINASIYTLAKHSKLMEGLMIENLEIEARKNGYKTKEEIRHYVQNKIKDKKDELEARELAYWTAQYENGILDLRSLEALFADPGMINSQIIQTVKQMMDANDMYSRNEMLQINPEIEDWYNKLDRPGGNTRSQYGRFLNKSKLYIPQTNTYEIIEDGVVIPEFISDYYNDRYELELEKSNLYRKKQYIVTKEGINKESTKKLNEIDTQIAELQEEFNKKVNIGKKTKTYFEKRENPAFKKLSDKDKEDLRFIHKNLKEADDRVDNKAKRLGIQLKNDVYIYRLPKQRMSTIEAGLDQTAANFTSKIRDIVRPPSDLDTENITDAEKEAINYSRGNSITDVEGNQLLDVPVFYRNDLEDPRLQSFDIPTLLSENHLATLNYQQSTMLEADLFVIKESVSSNNNDKILRTDQFNKKAIKDVGNVFKQKSTDNNLYRALASSIDQRIYKRSYSGIYSKNNYKLVKSVELLTKYSSLVSLTLNFKSALTTSLQGSVFRMIEGIAGEHFNMDDWRKGSMKAYAEIPEMIKDTQNFVHKSKTNLLIKYFGLEQRVSALSNKFVQDNFATKNLDSDALYAVTSIAENLVTAMLMYSMLNNIKVMDKDQNYIDKDGNIVTDTKKAMSLDEAFEVKNGILILNPKVSYTTRNFVSKFSEGNKIDADVAVEIGSYMKNVYDNMYGQYGENMKSMVQRNIFGKAVMSMKGWLPRGLHNRFRGITTAVPFLEDRLSFEDLRNPENIDKRFFSQASKSFHEGYHTTMLRFVTDYVGSFAKGAESLTIQSLYGNLTTHERANLTRSALELAAGLITFIAYKLLAAMAKAADDDDEMKSEYLYFVAYMSYRLSNEISTFVNLFELASIVENPAVAFGTINNIKKLMLRLFGFEYSLDEGFDFSINDRYEKGDKKDQLKIVTDLSKMGPGANNFLQILNLFGFNTGRTMEDQYKNQVLRD